MRQVQNSILRFGILSCLTVAGLGISSVARAECTGTNTCFGTDALPLDSGFNNSAFGFGALFSNAHVFLNGASNTAVGHMALFSNFDGNENTAVGDRALFFNTSGARNTAIGHVALPNNTTGEFNTAVGALALEVNTTGNHNTGVGMSALSGGADEKLTGSFNTASGSNALKATTSGNGNTGTGHDALHSNSSGFRNTATGVNALGNLTTGVRNTVIGAAAGKNLVTGSDNILIGAQNSGAATENGAIRIGIAAHQKKTFVAGIRGVTTGLSNATIVFIDGKGQLGTKKSSREFKEEIQPIASLSDRLMSLRPVSFRYKKEYDDGSKPIEFGLIAEEVAEAFPELVIYNADGNPETVRYDLVATLLLNEVKKERGVIEAQSLELARLKQEFAQMTEVIERLDRAARAGVTR